MSTATSGATGTSGAPGATEPLPSPAGLPVLGNLLQLPRARLMQHLHEVATRFDGVYALDVAGTRAIVVYGPDLVAELCDETRFRKVVTGPLSELRAAAGDGLFTARRNETNWGKAHRVLLPAFALRSVKDYFPAMLEVADELVASWQAREGEPLDVVDDMTRLTLDTIALTGFGQRFHSFRSPELHPFLAAMGRVLTEAQSRVTRLPHTERLYAARERRFQADIAQMFELVDAVIAGRHAAGDPGGRDLLGLMLTSPDPETGETLDDVNVRHQIITFLVAGHETTSGLLSFALHQLLRNPHVLAQAYAEVDRLLPGDTVPTYRHVNQLDVVSRVLDETLRLWSPAPGFTVAPYEDTTLGGRYRLQRNYPVSVLLAPLHRDPGAWPDPERFDVDRFRPEATAARQQRYPHAYQPFGNGARACIGRQFALVEAKLALALLLQRFALEDPGDYRLQIKETLTIKPDGFRLRVRARRPHERLHRPAPVAATGAPAPRDSVDVAARRLAGSTPGQPLTVLYGSTMQTCADVAARVAELGEAAGLPTALRPLDEAVGALPQTGLLVVVTATYNGEAPDGARAFDRALRDGATAALPDLRYAVLGCGNTQWSTYQAFPKRVDAFLAATGATPLLERAEADAAGDFDGAVDAWLGRLVEALAGLPGAVAAPTAPAAPRYRLALLDERATRPEIVGPQAVPMVVVENTELVADATGLWDHRLEAPARSTRHLVLALPPAPDGAPAYAVGDHLAVFGKNRSSLVARAARLLGLQVEQVVRVEQQHGRPSHLPLGAPVEVGRLLAEHVELQDTATAADVRALAEHTPCPRTAEQLRALAADDARLEAEVRAPRASLLDLLERHPAVALPLAVLLERCRPLRPRYYSISSSPAVSPGQASLTVGVIDAPAHAGTGQYKGLTSDHLARLEPGRTAFGFVRTPTPAFRPPPDPATPLLLVAAGTGIAPFRGFLQERAEQRARGQSVGRTVLLYGCRHPDHDWYYRDEVRAWAREGLVEPHLAHSAVAGHPYRFVQDAVRGRGEDVRALVAAGAHVRLCGDGLRMAPAVRAALAEVHGRAGDAAAAWLEGLQRDGRYAEDVFAPSR